MATSIIFGFGSLINSDSLRTTVFDITDIKPAYIKGFIREFNLWDAVGFRPDSPGFAGTPYCALDIRNVSDQKVRVNGVVFAVDDTQLDRLKNREHDYKLIRSTAYDFKTDENLGECYVFSACKDNGKYDFNSDAQTRYLQICLDGAKKFGDKFYQEFLNTTYVDGKPLNEVLKL